jgi:hypothetical protein
VGVCHIPQNVRVYSGDGLKLSCKLGETIELYGSFGEDGLQDESCTWSLGAIVTRPDGTGVGVVIENSAVAGVDYQGVGYTPSSVGVHTIRGQVAGSSENPPVDIVTYEADPSLDIKLHVWGEGSGPTTAATEGSGPSTTATEGTGPSTAATEGSGPSTTPTEGTGPSTTATEGE